MTSGTSHQQTNHPPTWRKLTNLTILSAYFYAFTEWLFFVTKPSSLSNLSAFELIKVLMVTGGAVTLMLLAGLVFLSLPAWLIKEPNLLILGALAPTSILAITALILIDNFTYTIFKYGVISTAGTTRFMYALGFTIVCWRIFAALLRMSRTRWASVSSFLSLGLLAVSLAGILAMGFDNLYAHDLNSNALGASSGSRPNILILGSDGLSAIYLSAYGFPIQTTPFLNEFAENSLVAENAFPNASNTTASTTSLLTGKEAIKVRVYRYPDILTGKNSFEHLPGILKQNGYQTVEIGAPYFVDAHRLNLLNGFDMVYNESLNLPILDLIRTVLGNSPSMFFIQTIFERAAERVLHIFFIRDMQNPISEVNNPEYRTSDEERVNQILGLVDHADRPIFIFAHLMDTHGPIFAHQKQVFSSGADTRAWDLNHYMDAILSYDGHVKEIYDHLAETGQLDNTIIVIYTDHGFQYTIDERIPIIIHFPENKYMGKLKHNVQVIDIPATLLDYLKIPIPKWMDGISLLKGEPPANREIFSTAASSPPKIGPPFYQLRLIQVITCQKWYTLSVKDNIFETGLISTHTAYCDNGVLPSTWEVHQTILEYLEKNGYKTSLLK